MKNVKKKNVKNMHICLLINSLEAGGAERVVCVLGQELAKKHNVTIITLAHSFFYDLPAGVKHISLTQSRHARSVRLAEYVIRLRAVLRRENPDVVVSFLELSNIANILCPKGTRTGKKVTTIISVRAHCSSVYATGLGNWFVRKMLRLLYPRADHVIANAELSRRDLIVNLGVAQELVSCVYNPFDTQHIRTLMREPLSEEHARFFHSGNVLVNVGGCHARKSGAHLVRAFYQLIHQPVRRHQDDQPKKTETNNVDAKLVIIGTGTQEMNLRALVRELGLQDRVLFTGQQQNVFAYMSRARAVVLSSWLEGFPNALVEAMICGTPVIATDCPSGPREILAPHTSIIKVATGMECVEFGILVPPASRKHDEERRALRELSRAMSLVLTDSKTSEKYAAKGFQRAQDFDREKSTKAFMNVLQNVK